MSRIETHKATSEKNEHIENKLKRCFKNKMHVLLTAKHLFSVCLDSRVHKLILVFGRLVQTSVYEMPN